MNKNQSADADKQRALEEALQYYEERKREFTLDNILKHDMFFALTLCDEAAKDPQKIFVLFLPAKNGHSRMKDY